MRRRGPQWLRHGVPCPVHSLFDHGKLRHEPPFSTCWKPCFMSQRRAMPLRVPDAQQTIIHWLGSRSRVPRSRSASGIFRLPAAFPAENSPGDRTSMTTAPLASRLGIFRRALILMAARVRIPAATSVIRTYCRISVEDVIAAVEPRSARRHSGPCGRRPRERRGRSPSLQEFPDPRDLGATRQGWALNRHP